MGTLFFETSSFTATLGDYLTVDERRGKGRRGGLRVVYYWLMNDGQFWMFAIYDKDELENLTAYQEKALKKAIGTELKARGTS